VIVAFLRFWWDFVVGDDWRIAAGVVVAIAAVGLLADAGIHAWWLLPAVVAITLGTAIRTAARSRA
jgi:hypothetical protein